MGEVRMYPAVQAGGYVLAFEFDGDTIARSYVRRWYN